jgi:hypothetical protein
MLYVGWDEATLLCLVVGPFLLFCSLVLALFYRWMAHTGASRLSLFPAYTSLLEPDDHPDETQTDEQSIERTDSYQEVGGTLPILRKKRTEKEQA